MKLATCNEPWRDVPVENVFEIAARLGFKGIELAPFTIAMHVAKISANRRKEIAHAARNTGLEIVGLHWLLVTPKGLHITCPDEEVRKQSADYLKQLADFCADVGGKVMTFGSPKQRSIEPPTTFEEGWKRARDVYAAGAETLATRGVTLCIEALAPAETNFINTVEQAAQMADEIGHPNINIMLDCKAISSMAGGPIEMIRRFGKRARHFHANEAGGKGVGMPVGENEPAPLDFKAIIKALIQSGYKGWISVEPFDYNPDPTTVAQAAIKVLKDALASAT